MQPRIRVAVAAVCILLAVVFVGSTTALAADELSATAADEAVDSTGDGATTSVTFDAESQTTPFDVNVTSSELDAADLFEIFDGENQANVDRVNGSETTIVIEGLEDGDDVQLSFSPVSAATYGFTFDATDTNATDTVSIAVTEREADAAFGRNVFATGAGDIVEVDIILDDTDEAYVMLGGDRDSGANALTNYFDILHVEGDATIRINTRLLGTDVPSEDVYTATTGAVTSYAHSPDDPAVDNVTFEGDAEDIESFKSDLGIGTLARPLQPDRYRLVAGLDGSVTVRDDGVPDFERPLARSNLLITETDGFRNVTTYVAPEGSANGIDDLENIGTELTDELTQRRTVAEGDRLVFEIEATGLTGVVSWLGERMDSNGPGIDPPTLSKLLEFPDGLRIDGRQTNPGINERVSRLDLDGATDGAVYLVPEPLRETDSARSMERYYLVFDTRKAGAFTRHPRPGDEYRFRFGYNSTGNANWFETVAHDAVAPNGAPPQFPYTDSATNVTETRFVTVEERRVEYDHLDIRRQPVVRNTENGTLSGRTNLAPRTDVTIQLVPENRTRTARIAIEDVEIAPDGTFNVTSDFSALASGDSVEVEFYATQRLVDKRAGVVIGEDEPLARYEITDHAGNVTVEPGDRLSSVFATVKNSGPVAGEQSVRLAIGGDRVAERTVELGGQRDTTISFGEEAIDVAPGEYAYTLSTADDEATGRLLVEGEREAEAGETADGGSEANTEESAESPPERGGEAPTDAEDEPTDGPDDEGGFGIVPVPVGARHAIGGAAVVGAVHVLGHWN